MFLQIRIKCGQAARESVDLRGLQTGGGALDEMRVPPAQVDAGDLQPQARFHDTSYLAKSGSEGSGPATRRPGSCRSFRHARSGLAPRNAIQWDCRNRLPGRSQVFLLGTAE